MSDINKKPIFLKGKKVSLRPLDKTDAPIITRWVNDPEIRELMAATFPQTETQQEEWMEKIVRNEYNIVLAVETLDDVFIGIMGIHRINWQDRVALTMACIGEKKYWGGGYGTDAKMMLLDYAFNTLNLHKMCSEIIAYNKRSLRYSLHCGYRIEGVRKRHTFKKGRYQDVVELGLFKKDWLPIWINYQKTGTIRQVHKLRETP